MRPPGHRALLLAGGPAPPPAFVRACHRPGDRVLAADRGLELARDSGLAVDLLVGDLDSLAPGAEQGVETLRYPVRKDSSDLELALEEAARGGAGECLVLGALGGRLDHTLFNVIALLARSEELGLRARLAGPGTEVFQAGPGRHEIVGRGGWTCSVLPLDPQARLTLEGLEYPLKGEWLRRASTRGLSNRILGEQARIEIHEGRVLVLLEFSPPEEGAGPGPPGGSPGPDPARRA